MGWDRIGSKAGKIFFVGSFVAFAVAVLCSHEAPILRDYPDWVYQGVLLARAVTGHPVAGYALKPHAVPNSMTTAALGMMTVVFGWVLAAKLWMVLYLALAAVTSLYAGAVFEVKEGALWWVLPVTIFLGQLFWFGTISFNIGLCILLLIACRLYRRLESAWGLGMLLVVCFFVHLIVYASAVLMILLYCLQHRRWKLTYAALATTPLVAWYFAGRLLVPSGESEIGHSPMSHVALTMALALTLLAIGYFRRQRSIHAVCAPVLIALSLLLGAAGLASAFVRGAPLSDRAVSNLFLVQLKASQPLMLFGFVNISRYEQAHDRVLSASLQIFHEPLFLGLMLLDIGLGIVILSTLGGALMKRRRDSGRAGGEAPDDASFLWDFVVVLGLLYLVCPPNALGVVSIDMRLAQIGLAPALFLLARRPNRWLRIVSVPSAILLVASLYQFGVSQRGERIAGRPMALPHILNYFGGVNPGAELKEYEALRSGRFDHWIFPTGPFVETTEKGCCHDD